VSCPLWLLQQVDSITIPVGPRLGGKVVEVSQLRKAFGDKLLVDDATFSIPPGDQTHMDGLDPMQPMGVCCKRL
jgi:ATPase subunit of ABC transporter with duplicated ATPase domains